MRALPGTIFAERSNGLADSKGHDLRGRMHRRFAVILEGPNARQAAIQRAGHGGNHEERDSKDNALESHFTVSAADAICRFAVKAIATRGFRMSAQ